MAIPKSMSVAARQNLLEPSEGCRLAAYRDVAGVWTIGYGHTSAAGDPVVKSGLRITLGQADTILSADLGVFERGVAAALSGVANVPQREFDALVDLAFNIGLAAFRSSSLLRAYRAGDRATACRKFADWNKSGGKVVAGLVARRAREQRWFVDGRLNARTAPVGLLDYGAAEDMARAVDHPDGLFARAANRLVLWRATA